jgi:pyruvate formate lyase activating enzyme
MPEFPRISPAGLVNKAAESGCGQIAYTYSEPLVHFEYLLDCMEQARGAGIANILVSNGCVNEEPAAEILALTDAVNVDLKSFSADTYSKVLGGDLETVLRFIRAAAALGVHLEITTLVVPGLNDGEDEIDAAAAFVAGLSAGSGSGGAASDKTPVIPWHLSAYHPDWKWHAPAKPGVLLQTARRIRDRYPGLRNRVYIGNSEAPAEQTPGQAVEFWDTVCSACGAVLVRRGHGRSFLSGKNPLPALELRNSADGPRYYCAACGNPAPIFAAKGTPAVNE